MALRQDLTQERTFLGEDELVFLGKAEILHALFVGTEASAIFLVGREACEGNQRERDVVGAFMRHPVADEIAAASRDDGEPAFGILLEHPALERIDLIADENGDGHREPPVFRCCHCEERKRRSNPEIRPWLDWIASLTLAMTRLMLTSATLPA